MADAYGSFDTRQDNYFLYTHYDWEVTFDIVNMLALWTISATVRRTYVGTFSTSYATSIEGTTADNYIKLNNNVIWSIAAGNTGSTLHPYVYTGEGSVCADRISGSRYSGSLAGKYPYGFCHLVQNYQFTTPIDLDGRVSLTIESSLKGNDNTISPSTSDHLLKTLTSGSDGIPFAEIYSRLGYKENGIWTNNARIWRKENGIWIKKNFYHKSNNTWSKV